MNLARLPIAVTTAAVLALAACSSTTQLDMDKLEGALQGQLPQSEELKSLVGEATCPDAGDVKVEAGGTFECTLVVDGQPVRVKVTQDDDEGNVSYERLDAVIDLALLRDEVAAGIEEQLDVQAEVDCGTTSVKVAAPGSTFECTATDASGQSETVTVTVKDVEGNIDWAVG